MVMPRLPRRQTDFRGDSAAASLKRQHDHDQTAAGWHFRGDSAAASLKLTYDRQLQRRYWNFRGDSAAASLKHPVAGVYADPAGEFPRRFRRGLIEALVRWHQSRRCGRYFRGDSAAASLKRDGRVQSIIVPTDFRGDSAAASLKRQHLIGDQRGIGISAAIPPRPH